ncbi:hypothetical protein PM082_005350 [Marasmius tenuissimus]|nr:hypothetical protein PM082_005350 [Marasmius tenuissimus]
MHFNTYLAAIRHRGCYDNHNLNELLTPFFRSVAPVWAKIFEGDKFFSPFHVSSTQIISSLLEEVESSTTHECLKRRINSQRIVCLEHAKNAFVQAFYILQDAVKEKQKEISRSLVPQVNDRLGDGYNTAMEIKGKGCVKRQKFATHSRISHKRGRSRWDHDRDEDKEGLAVKLKATNVVAEVMKRSTVWLETVAELDEEQVVQRLLDVSLT